jgi:hypothetical protein
MEEVQEAADFDGCREEFHRKGAKVAEGREAGTMKGEGLGNESKRGGAEVAERRR